MADDSISSIAGTALPGLAGASAFGQAGLGLEGVGAAMGVAGAIGQYSAQQGIYQSGQNIAALEGQSNAIKFAQSKMQSRRAGLQEIRNAQVARSLSLSAATNQGASTGSGYKGAQGQISGQEFTNLLGISQNQQYGQQIYDVNQSISAQEQQISKYQGQAAMWSGLTGAGSGASSLGSSFVKSSTNPSGSLF